MSLLLPLHSVSPEDLVLKAPSVLPKLNFWVFDFPTPISPFLHAGAETWKNALPFKPAPPLASNPTSCTKLSLCVLWSWRRLWGST